MIRPFAFVAALLCSWAAFAEPWQVSGQTFFTGLYGLTNPEPNCMQTTNPVCELPYIVPEECTLTVRCYGIETSSIGPAGQEVDGTADIYIFTDPKNEAKTASMTIVARQQGHETCGQNLEFISGTEIHVHTGHRLKGVWGWYVSGDLNCSE